jgi:hypothetical protein
MEKKKVILKMRIENKNKNVKCYICLDKKEYTMYLDEREVLLQAGLKAELESVELINKGDVTVFNLYISDASVVRE